MNICFIIFIPTAALTPNQDTSNYVEDAFEVQGIDSSKLISMMPKMPIYFGIIYSIYPSLCYYALLDIR